MREEEAALEEGIQQQGNVTAGKGSDGFPFGGKGSFLPVTSPSLSPGPGIRVEPGDEWRNQLGDGQRPGGHQGMS